MKIVFLDIDGVLNSARWMKRVHEDLHFRRMSFLERHANELEPRAVKLLSDFIVEVGAKVVISSSWRHLHTPEEIREMLLDQGWDPAIEVIDATPNSKSGFRGEEVNEWLRRHPQVIAHVIFDDDSDFHHVQPLVKTSWEDGLQPFHIEVARELLTNQT